MKNRRLGQMINEERSIEEITAEFPDFELTTEYFIKIGYKKSTAQKYVSRLLRASKSIKRLSNIISTDNADFNNLIVDTCALARQECIAIIEAAKQVTFIYKTLQEMDKKDYEDLIVRKFGRDTTFSRLKLAQNIRIYTLKAVEEEKFLLSTFSGYKEGEYCDDVIIEYLGILPKQIRPTVLTADKNLAAKAKAHGFDCIFRKSDEVDVFENQTKVKL